MKLPALILSALLAPVSSTLAASPTDLLTQLEAAVVNDDEKGAQELWRQITPDFDRLSAVDQGRYLVVQGLIQEDILGDINAADQSFNRVISLLGAAPPAQALADAYYERAYIKY